MMPIRDVVIFPHMMTPFVVGRESSVRALEEALAGDKKIFLATQHDASVDEPRPDEIFSVGTVANIVQSLQAVRRQHQSSGRRRRARQSASRSARKTATSAPRSRPSAIKIDAGPQLDALISRVTNLFEQYVKISQNVNYDTMVAAVRVDDPGKLGRHRRRESPACRSRKSRSCSKSSIPSTG